MGFLFKQETAYEVRISDWSSDVCSSDLTRRGGVEDAFIVVPEGAEWAQDRSALWSAAEAAEKRKDAKVAREYELGLPAELDAGQRRDLVRHVAEDLRHRSGVAVDAAIDADWQSVV